MEKTTQSTQIIHKSITDVTDSAWAKLSEKKIYFGHQSVGFNILHGVEDILKTYPKINMTIVKTKDPAMLKNGVFAHSEVGRNTDPISKLNDFTDIMDKGIGNNADLALMKFCYVDIGENSDVKNIFSTYKQSYDQLKNKFPNTTFIHVTTPLTSKRSDLLTLTKNIIKKLMGRQVRTYQDNIKRDEFNKMLLETYEGKEPIFDLAKVESTDDDGYRLTYLKEGTKFPAMIPTYTNDGGHLNDEGRKKIAEQFLIFLADLPDGIGVVAESNRE